MDKVERLTDLQWDTCWMAIRYAMGRRSISSATLPKQIVQEYYNKIGEGRKSLIARDLQQFLDEGGKFGDPGIDDVIWFKFLAAMKFRDHKEITTIDGSKVMVFEANGRVYPLEQYVKNPWIECFIPKENIASWAQ